MKEGKLLYFEQADNLSGKATYRMQIAEASAARWAKDSLHCLCSMNTTFKEKIYTSWCCIDRLSRQDFTGGGTLNVVLVHAKGCRLRVFEITTCDSVLYKGNS